LAKNYINNRDFYNAIVQYKLQCEAARDAGKEKPRIPNYIGECIFSIANKYSNKPSFIGYSFKEEMISDAIRDCILYFDSFDTDKGQNAFAYFTQVCHNAFIRRIHKEKKEQYIKYKNMYHVLDMTQDIVGTAAIDRAVQDEFIEQYEEGLKKKKEKKMKETK
jgi:hypothetical protein